MCGICGLTGLDDTSPIQRMVAAMAHRGPDDCGVYTHHQTALGMARLAIIDTSPAGHQPMSDEQGEVWIVFNGEMYNFRSERALLEQRGYAFRSQSDTEVILQMYRHYGDAFLSRIRGMFALAIYDQPRQRLLLARDQMGIKPLLYAQVGDALVFGSEIKTLLASGRISRDFDPVALRQLLTYGSVCQPRTLLRQVSALLPAHYAVMEKGSLKIERYWSLGTNRMPELAALPYDEQVQAVAAALDESVRLQMMSDVPLGAFLSGGVDSGLLVALMAQHASARLKTYSVGFQAEGEQIDESQDAARSSRHHGHWGRCARPHPSHRQRSRSADGGWGEYLFCVAGGAAGLHSSHLWHRRRRIVRRLSLV
jgi:asparagine synthase (glutamine-hydrolysing)